MLTPVHFRATPVPTGIRRADLGGPKGQNPGGVTLAETNRSWAAFGRPMAT